MCKAFSVAVILLSFVMTGCFHDRTNSTDHDAAPTNYLGAWFESYPEVGLRHTGFILLRGGYGSFMKNNNKGGQLRWNVLDGNLEITGLDEEGNASEPIVYRSRLATNGDTLVLSRLDGSDEYTLYREPLSLEGKGSMDKLTSAMKNSGVSLAPLPEDTPNWLFKDWQATDGGIVFSPGGYAVSKHGGGGGFDHLMRWTLDGNTITTYTLDEAGKLEVRSGQYHYSDETGLTISPSVHPDGITAFPLTLR